VHRILIAVWCCCSIPEQASRLATSEVRLRRNARERFGGRDLRPLRLKKRALRMSLKRGEEVGLVIAQDRTEVSEQLRQGLPRGAQRRRCLAAQLASKRALRALKAPPQPIATRERKTSARLPQPRRAPSGLRALPAQSKRGSECGQRNRPARSSAPLRTCGHNPNEGRGSSRKNVDLAIPGPNCVPRSRAGTRDRSVPRQWGQATSLMPSKTPQSAGVSLAKRGALNGDAKGRTP
jgi:hypothetical protein